ncbi:MAG: leucine-rich repeat domain-containing protein, partial [Eubacterium sp.]|nr:leucine-rich repeat domain-containing protein [Eubacterium sp.]
MRWAVWSIQYCLDFDENIDSSEVKKLLVKDGLTILDCHSLVGSLFEWENLTEMTLPKSIKKIQGNFSKCPSLKTINYAGTKEDWDKIIF